MTDIRQRAAQLMSGSIVWDNHGCMPLRPLDESFLPQLARYRASGVDVASLNIGYGEESIETHLRMAGQFRRWLKQRPDEYVLVESVADIDRAKAAGQLAITFDIEGMGAIGDQLSLIELYYDLGVRWMSVAYNKRNLVGSGCHDDEDYGLTAFGREAIREMERVGMVLCCSHTGRRTAMEALEWSRQPAIFSHSNSTIVWPHDRNIGDAAMQACAATGGVVGITGVGIFVGDNDITTDAVIRHVDHAVSLIGPDHVGFGFDFVFDLEELYADMAKPTEIFPDDPSYRLRVQFVPPEQMIEIVEGLLARGYAEADVAKIMGGNHLRIAEQVWR